MMVLNRRTITLERFTDKKHTLARLRANANGERLEGFAATLFAATYSRRSGIVVSTTLASLSRLFVIMGQESLGWLLVDEAGQATPQSVAGALWRARRAIVVGDPQQIEPVMTVPQSLLMRLQDLRRVDATCSPSHQSAQALADRSMTMGAWVSQTAGNRVWTSIPLRANRRCDSPHVRHREWDRLCGSDGSSHDVLPAVNCPSGGQFRAGSEWWFDVRGRSAEAQVVREEIQALAALLGQLCGSWPSFGEGRPANVFLISPFKRVARACEEVAKRWGASSRGRIRCGTVHTFQGKEAEIVFFVLGSAPGRPGRGSRRWASEKPNLLNVALTRAKLRIYVIGNRLDWSDFFPTLLSGLEPREVPGHSAFAQFSDARPEPS
jgi:hypothetical protein